MPDVTMPRLSDSMEEGTILRWLKADGDEVRRGDELAEIETDKATATYEAEADGVLTTVAKEGDTLPIGEVIARLGEGSGGNGAGPAQREEPVAAEAPAPAPREQPEGIRASPVARRMAERKGIDLSTIEGTGPGGRIVKSDVAPEEVRRPAPAPAPAAPTAPVSEKGTAKGDVAIQEPTRTQQVVARRMAESKATIPDFSIQTVVDMGRAVEARAQLKAIADPVPSYNDMVVKAAALALRAFPRANGSYRDGKFELFSRVNVGIAVAAQDALVVPTIFDADTKGLGEIARESRALAQRVRDGAVTPPELSGGTFTISNLGMYGVTQMTPVINPPQAAILGVGAITAGDQMNLTLVCDHRILYGADAAQFLARIRELLEQPLGLAL
jgi:pyruvate dehydrogenase E2 component (dihydrolipoamide acetyltransferase)